MFFSDLHWLHFRTEILICRLVQCVCPCFLGAKQTNGKDENNCARTFHDTYYCRVGGEV